MLVEAFSKFYSIYMFNLFFTFKYEFGSLEWVSYKNIKGFSETQSSTKINNQRG